MALAKGEKQRKRQTETAIRDISINNELIDKMTATEKGARSECDEKR